MPIASRFAAAAARAYGMFRVAASAAVDPFFNYVTALLPGNGTNGAQNNTFLDSSSNAFTITRNGNTTQGTFTPFSQTGWGNYFDGSSNLVTSSSQVIPTGSFTIEAWAFVTSSSATQTILAQGTGVGDAARTWIGIESSSGAKWAVQIGGTQAISSLTPTLNVWTHVAMTYNGSTITLYVNGTSVASASVTQNASNTTLKVGANWGSYNLTGYVSNARVSNSVIYSGNFTPSTAPFSAASGTVFLSCQSNRFVDNSSNAYAITVTGSPSVQAFSPFAPTASYSASTVGGSGYFDGSGDYLQAGTNANLALGSGNFTIEGWLYCTGYNGGAALYSTINTYPSSTGLLFYIDLLGKYTIDVNGTILQPAGAATLNTWTHWAVVRNSTTLSIYINGTSIGSVSSSTNFTDQYAVVGRTGAGTNSNLWLGYLTDTRMVKGTAVYTANFTPPTAPLTAIANTQLLLSYTNGGITDATAKNDLETVGNAQISTTQSKFGGSSMYFDGAGDYLTAANSALFDFGAGDFTIEMWVYPTAVGQSSLTLLYCKPNGSGYSGIAIGQAISGYGAVIYASSTGTTWNLASGVSAGTMTANAWNHVAVCRYGTNLYGFVNGILGSTTSVSTTALVSTTTQVSIGSSLGTANTYLTGYIDDLRITKGIARYTSNFAPPTSAFLTL